MYGQPAVSILIDLAAYMDAVLAAHAELKQYARHVPIPDVLRALVLGYEGRGVWNVPLLMVTEVVAVALPGTAAFVLDDYDVVFDVAIFPREVPSYVLNRQDRPPLVMVHGKRRGMVSTVWMYSSSCGPYELVGSRPLPGDVPWLFGSMEPRPTMNDILAERDELEAYGQHMPVPDALRMLVLQYENRDLWNVPREMAHRAVAAMMPGHDIVLSDIGLVYDVVVTRRDQGTADQHPVVMVRGTMKWGRHDIHDIWVYVTNGSRYMIDHERHAPRYAEHLPWLFGTQARQKQRLTRAASAYLSDPP
jgi:hypothetical protein